MKFDSTGRLLRGSSLGLATHDKESGAVVSRVGPGAGLAGGEFTTSRSLHLTTDGRLVGGMDEGASLIDLAALRGVSPLPAPVALRVEGAPFERAESGLRLERGPWSLDVFPAVPWFLDERGLRFRYRMAGFVEDWTDLPRDSASIRFTSLPVGRYELEAQAMSELAGAGPASTLLAFEIDVAAAADEVALIGQINTDLGAFGTATIGADGQLDITLAAADQGIAIAEGDSSIRVTDAAARERDYGFSHYFGLNDFLVNDGPRATDLEVLPELAADPARLGSSRLDVETPPAVATLTATLGGPGDNRGAKGLAETLQADYAMLARGKLPARTTDLGAYAAEIVAITAMEASRAEEAARSDVALSDAVNFKADSVSSVNLDEEIATLMTLQQAYSVAARLISTVDEMLEELLNSAR